MYRKEQKTQLSFDDFYLPFGGSLNQKNRWVVLAALVPWEKFENKYAEQFSESGMGAPAKSFRIALGSLLIKEKLNITDEETIDQIRENPYLQYFIGMEGYRDEIPFDSSMMVHFRKRITLAMLGEINEQIQEAYSKKKAQKENSIQQNNIETPTNQGKLLVDATCTPADISYPTDLSLLNEVREKTEAIIDRLHSELKGTEKKVRTYRIKARKEYLKVSKKRRKGEKELRRAIRKQLSYVKRNLLYIKNLESKTSFVSLSKKQYRDLLVCSEVYRQQELMHRKKDHQVEDRIVSISQPHVRPIVRGKAGAAVEFGAKLTISVVDGFTCIEKLSWDNYNEGIDLIEQIEKYKNRFGYYPESVHGDKIYQNRTNRKYCKENNIRMSGPQLGRPAKEKEELREKKKITKQDEKDRIPVEGKFGNAKRKYGLNRIMAKRADTSETTIAIIILVLNLERILSGFFSVFLFLQRIRSNYKKNNVEKKVRNTFNPSLVA